jgi:hypothetical protein
MPISIITTCLTVPYLGGKMKKIIALFVVFLCVGAALSAQMSFGGGALIDYIGNNGSRTTYSEDLVKENSALKDSRAGTRTLGIGGFAFFDVMYAEISLDFSYGLHTGFTKIGDADASTTDAGSSLNLGFSLLGKYPVDMGAVILYPMAGLGYNIVLSSKDASGNNPYENVDDRSAASDLSQFFLMAGGGLDYSINRNVYLRVQALFQMRFANKVTRDGVDLANKGWDDMGEPYKSGATTSSSLGIGPRIKVGIGYRF